jgi:uncharacterized protein YegP (UPF0339 family)
MGKYKIKISKNNQYYWVLVARNGKVILTSSEQYTQKHNCKKSIKALNGKRWRWLAMGNIKKSGYIAYFYAKNGETLAGTECYKTRYGMGRGIVCVVKYIATGKIIDETI